ncbi:MAG: HD domain-containing phosphohydrolase [Anaerolineales bacterium]
MPEKKGRKLFKQFTSSIQVKITLPYILLSMIVAVGGAYLITQLMVRSVDRRFKNSLIETAKISADLLVQEEDQILETVRLIANTINVDQYILEENSEGLRDIIVPLAFNTAEDMVHILDLNGVSQLSLLKDARGRYPVYEASRGSDFFASYEFVQQVLDQDADNFGDKFAGLVDFNGDNYLFIAGPVFNDAGELVGAVLVGSALEEFLTEARQETLAQVSIYHLDGSLAGSTLGSQIPLTRSEAEEVIETQDSQSYLRETMISDIRYREILFCFEVREKIDFGIMGLALSTGFLEETNQDIQIQVFILVAVLLFLTILVGIVIARMITHPIDKLKAAAMEVSSGNLNVKVEPIGEDEIAVLTRTFNQMVSNLRESNDLIIDAYDKTLEGWSKALELRDRETEGHTIRVTRMTLALAKLYGFDGDQLENIRRGSLIHDIGKFSVPDSVLLKPSTLTDDEYDVMKEHPVHAYEMLSNIPFLQGAIDIPYCHHEHWDGGGYPQGLKGEEIPVAARLFTVCDVWDAITTDRPYRDAMSQKKAVKLMREGSGTTFDPNIVDLFLDNLDSLVED